MKKVLCVAVMLTTSMAAQSRPQYIPPETAARLAGPWSEPHEPFKILDNLYYVGAQNIGAYLFTSPQGHILLDTGMPRMAKSVIASIEKLGFKPADVEIMLSSHAHVDHVGGHAEVQKGTGARVMALGADAEALQLGRDLSPIEFDGWSPVKVDRVLKDGDTVTLGPWTLRAVHIPGHTPGATTWVTAAKDGDRSYNIVFVGGGAPNAGPPVVGNPKHPHLAEDTLMTFKRMRELRPDIQLTNHPQMLLAGKLEAIKQGLRPHPLLVTQAEWEKGFDAQEAAFRKRIEADKAKTPK